LLDSDDHSGAVRALDWSFHSQGTKEQQASADEFFDRALRWFGEAEPENFKDPWVKGERLAELVREQPTLLILDGMEPLQHPPGPMAGELTDPSIKALLEGLQRDNPGLCIVTTRETVPTLDEMNEPKRVTIDLETLSPQAGAELLRHYGVRDVGGVSDPTNLKDPTNLQHGKVGSETQPTELDELRQASVDVGGHALALILLGTYLKPCSWAAATRSGSEPLNASAPPACLPTIRIQIGNRKSKIGNPWTLTHSFENTSPSSSTNTIRPQAKRRTAAFMSTSNSPPPTCPTISTT
jgi:hypothetical protein